MTYAHLEAARFLLACTLVGATLGALVALARGREAHHG